MNKTGTNTKLTVNCILMLSLHAYIAWGASPDVNLSSDHGLWGIVSGLYFELDSEPAPIIGYLSNGDPLRQYVKRDWMVEMSYRILDVFDKNKTSRSFKHVQRTAAKDSGDCKVTQFDGSFRMTLKQSTKLKYFNIYMKSNKLIKPHVLAFFPPRLRYIIN